MVFQTQVTYIYMEGCTHSTAWNWTASDFFRICFSIICFHFVYPFTFYHFWRQEYLEIYCKVIIVKSGLTTNAYAVADGYLLITKTNQPHICNHPLQGCQFTHIGYVTHSFAQFLMLTHRAMIISHIHYKAIQQLGVVLPGTNQT